MAAPSVRTSAPSGTRTVFPKGPSFSLDTFSSKDFMVKDFVESLSDSAVPINRRSGPSTQAAFDPKPLIRAFEHALSSLNELSDDLTVHETELLTAVRRAEAQHKQTLDSLGKKLDQSISSFQTLDTDLNSSQDGETGGIVAVKIGDKLEELDRQARRARDANFLIQCWLDATERGELSALEELRRRPEADAKVRCAVIARQLMKISQRLDQDNWGQTNGTTPVNGAKKKSPKGQPKAYNTRELIEKFSETLEKDLLKQFDHFYRKRSWEGMRDCANVLYDFNGGSNVIALFVNQHQYFIDQGQLMTEEIAFDNSAYADPPFYSWEQLADPDADSPGAEPNLQSFIDELHQTLEEESAIIKKAFPYYESVMSRFLQRVFQQPIQQRLEVVLKKADTVSSLAFLRSLQASRSSLSSLVESLKSHGLTEHPDPVSSQTTLVLDQQLEELFVPYLVGTSYIEREKSNLEELYTSVLFKYTLYHSQRKKLPTGFMASLAKTGSEMLATAIKSYHDRLDSSDLTPSQKAMLLRVAGLKDSEANKNKPELNISDEDGTLSVQTAKRMLRWLAEGVGRGLELSGGVETPKAVSSLLNLLLENLGELYVETALDAATDLAASQESSKTEPDLSFLPTLRAAASITFLMTTCINTVLLPLATSNLSLKRDMEKARDAAISHIEEKASAVLQRSTDAALAWVSRALARQLKTDFRPRDESDTAWLEKLQTDTCAAITGFLEKVHNLAGLALTGANRAAFLTELALMVRGALLEHFKKFQVSALGALMVQKDVRRYLTVLQAWEVQAHVREGLEVLGEVGSLFVVKPEGLRDRVRMGTLAGVGGEVLRPYLMRREDAGSVGMQSVLAAL
ncbi:MAG: Exocyst complex component 5 [Vezdaea aestivalis]|nr:MAG: Exocyst complex component 5 [Vezdaea aestivalis]